MKIKTDFVTNSSSTSFILSYDAKLQNGEEISEYIGGSVPTTFNCMLILEGQLQRMFGIKEEEIEVMYEQYIFDFTGDGWDEGDHKEHDYYTYVGQGGPGYRFFGNIPIAEEVLNKKETKLLFKNGKLEYPEDWKIECEPEVVKVRFNIKED